MALHFEKLIVSLLDAESCRSPTSCLEQYLAAAMELNTHLR